jgi:hypothetical protein
MISHEQHQKEKMFIEKYIYGKDEHGKNISGGCPIKEYVDSIMTSHIGLERLQDLSVPIGLVHIQPNRNSLRHSGGGGSKQPLCHEIKIMGNDQLDKMLQSVCHRGSNRTSRKIRKKSV